MNGSFGSRMRKRDLDTSTLSRKAAAFLWVHWGDKRFSFYLLFLFVFFFFFFFRFSLSLSLTLFFTSFTARDKRSSVAGLHQHLLSKCYKTFPFTFSQLHQLSLFSVVLFQCRHSPRCVEQAISITTFRLMFCATFCHCLYCTA